MGETDTYPGLGTDVQANFGICCCTHYSMQLATVPIVFVNNQRLCHDVVSQ